MPHARTSTPMVTLTPTITTTPTITIKPTSTKTFTPRPLSDLSKQAIRTSINGGLLRSKNFCNNYQDCTAFKSNSHYFIIVIYSDGRIETTVNDYYSLVLNKVEIPGEKPTYISELKWTTDFFAKIYDPSLNPWIEATLDMTNSRGGTFEAVGVPGYKIVGNSLEDHKIQISIIPLQ